MSKKRKAENNKGAMDDESQKDDWDKAKIIGGFLMPIAVLICQPTRQPG